MNVVIETDRSTVYYVFYVHYVAQKVMVYVQFNENTKHTFRRLYCYIYFIPRLLLTHKVTVYDIFLCRHTVQMYSLRSLSELLNIIRNLTLY